ncbi:MAG: hypothetical protein AAFU41_20640 [Pseudomonadota bacterium]
MPDRPDSIIFHIGVHKTATSHLQRCLQRARDPLAAAGVAYRGPADLRLPGQSLPARFGFGKHTQKGIAPVQALAAMAEGAQRLVLSEENFIGPLLRRPRDAETPRYADAGARLAQLAAALGQEVDVCMAIRHPLGFLTAAYSQSLIAGQIMPPQRFQRLNSASAVRWVDLADAVRQAAGVRSVTLWRYEDYQPLFPQIMTALVGPAASHVAYVDRYIHRGLSEAAVAAVLHRNKADGLNLTGQAARELHPVSDQHPAFSGYDADALAMADQGYAATCDRIAAMQGITFLRPGA